VATAAKYPALQILRAVAASFVILDHAGNNAVQGWTHADRLTHIAWSLGDVGVIVFFGISGFIMTTTQFSSFGSSARSVDFFLRRLLRIVPIYVVATTFQYANKHHLHGDYNWLNYAKSLLFIPYLDSDQQYAPVLAQGWTLDYEMFFYLVFAVSLSMKRWHGLVLSMVPLTALALLQGSYLQNTVVTFYLNHILLYFVCGMLVGIIGHYHSLTTHRIAVPLALVVILMGLTSALHGILSEPLYIAWSMPVVFACVAICAYCRPRQPGRIQQALERQGDASYSTYLFHGFMLGALKVVSNHIPDRQYTFVAAFMLVSLVACNATGYAAFRWIERPLTRFMNTRYRRTPPARAVAAAT
jgi:exopolysaccharide production protein ExoZ